MKFSLHEKFWSKVTKLNKKNNKLFIKTAAY